MATKKKKNIIVRYFTPFGIKQVCDITLFLAAVLTILGLSLFESTTIFILPIGIGLFILGGLMALFMSTKVLLAGINKRSPEFKQAIVTTIIMGLLTAIAVFALIFYFVYYFA